VPYRGDREVYIQEAGQVVTAALMSALQPRLDALEAERAASQARIDALNAEREKFTREFEAFKRMKTPGTIQ
jgi:hypothetical protein